VRIKIFGLISGIWVLSTTMISFAEVQINNIKFKDDGRIIFSDNSEQATATLQGPQGPIGPQGSVGSQGPVGPQGPAGQGASWVNVTSTAQQADSGHGYLANNDSGRVVISLPTSPAIGDTIRITGIGSGGWQIAQNPDQAVFLWQGANTWTPITIPSMSVNGVASSADGKKLAVANWQGTIYVSSDAGATWAASSSPSAY